MNDQNQASDDSGVSHRAVEITVALFVLAFGVAVAVSSYNIGIGWGAEGPQAGYFPFYIGVFICISALVTLAQAIWGKARHEHKIFAAWGPLKQVFAVLVPAAAFVVGIQFVGLYIAAGIYIAAFMIWLGKYSWTRSVTIGAVISIAAFLTFEIWFQVPLYKGILDPLAFLGY